jgi:hypothetical protein
MEQEKDQFNIEREEVQKKRKNRRTEPSSKAPLPFRIIAWISLVVVCFGLGYGGTSMVLGILGKKEIVVQKDVVSNTEQAADLVSEGQKTNSDVIPARKVLFNLYVPSEQGLSSRQVPIVSGLMEEDVKRVIASLVAESAPTGYLNNDIRVLHVFRNGEIMYLDFNRAFLVSLRNMGKQKAAIVMTSIVRTMVENFSPVTKVRIMVEGKVPHGSDPVDLSVPWQLSAS